MKTNNQKLPVRPDNGIDTEMPEAFTFHHDAGHGWLEVPYAAVAALKITKEVSSFSYRSNDTAFLEEDCDAPLFVNAYIRHTGTSIESFKDRVQNEYDGYHSFIRRLLRF